MKALKNLWNNSNPADYVCKLPNNRIDYIELRRLECESRNEVRFRDD